MNLLAILVDKGILSAKDRAEVEAGLSQDRSLSEVLEEHGVALPDALTKVGAAYGIPARVLGEPPADEETFGYIPIESAQHYGFVPIDKVDGVLEVGIIDPDNIEAIDALQFISGKIGIPYKIILITKQDFDRVIAAYQNLSGEVGKALSEYETMRKPTENGSSASASADDNDMLRGDEILSLTSKGETLKEDARSRRRRY